VEEQMQDYKPGKDKAGCIVEESPVRSGQIQEDLVRDQISTAPESLSTRRKHKEQNKL
jgi:hypothetical protein